MRCFIIPNAVHHLTRLRLRTPAHPDQLFRLIASSRSD
jgi:hypothetical protein